jgi:hypothetical protein
VTAKDVDTQFDCDRIISLEEVLEDYKREKESFKKCEGGRIEV